MPYKYDAETRQITISAGDTMDIPISISGTVYDAVLFVVYSRTRGGGGDVLRIASPLTNNATVIRLANRHTQDIAEGKYKWNLRFINDPAYDENGEIIIDEDSDDVWTAFGPDHDDVPDFIVKLNGGVLARDLKPVFVTICGESICGEAICGKT